MGPIEFAKQKGVLDEDMPDFLSSLANDLYTQFQTTQEETEICTAIEYSRAAISLTAGDSSSLLDRMHRHGRMLQTRFNLTFEPEDLEGAIEVALDVLDKAADANPNRVRYLTSLANAFELHYGQTDDISDLGRIVDVSEQAVDSTAPDNPERAASLSNLANAYELRYTRLENQDDIDKAINLAQRSVDFTPQNEDDTAVSLSILANMFESRHQGTGSLADLENAIQAAQRSVDLLGKNNPYRSACLNNLANKLQVQYIRTGVLGTLERAIHTIRQALDLLPENHPDRPGELNSLGNMLGLRYKRTKQKPPADLEEAIDLLNQAVQKTPVGDPDRACWLNNLADKYCMLWEEFRRAGDLEKALEAAKSALEAIPNESMDYVSFLNNLGTMLERKYQHTHDVDALKEAIKLVRRAIGLTREGHPESAGWYRNLGFMLQSLFEETKDPSHLEEALQRFITCGQMIQAPYLFRVQSYRAAMKVLQSQGNLERAKQIGIEALNLLPLVCGRYLSLEDQQHAIIQTSGLATDTCSIILKTGNVEEALQQLEFGRGLILAYMIDNRSDISTLRKDKSDLAERYESLRSKISKEVDFRKLASWEFALREREKDIKDIEKCIDQIRRIPHHERFLQKPAVGELQNVAAEGPIVLVNVTDISSDAIILSHDQVKAIPLPALSSEAAITSLQRGFQYYTSVRRGEFQRDMGGEEESLMESHTLTWLWDGCVKLVFNELRGMDILNSGNTRVWWMGSGIATSFPFHAAGSDFKNASENALDLVVSSYTPTIKALEYSRSQTSMHGRNGTGNEADSVLIVTMPTTPGQIDLSGVDKEKDAIKFICKGVCPFEELRLPTTEKVVEKIPHATIVHFACHGVSDRANPFESHLLLQKAGELEPVADKLTVSRISTVRTQDKPKIIFLSACSTAQVKVKKLADEGVHLASAFQLAGSPHVIGSLWAVEDNICAKIAGLFYHIVVKEGQSEFSIQSVPGVLARAVKQIRSESPDRPDLWAPFIHFGA